jgi:hypothetical protein
MHSAPRLKRKHPSGLSGATLINKPVRLANDFVVI